jgi:hypothetical protein
MPRAPPSARQTLAALAAATPVDDIDRVTLAAMRERLGLAEEIYAAGLDELDCNVLASPMQSIRSVFDLMDTSDDVSRTVFAVRLTKVAPALEQWTESLAAAAAKGLVPARRQVLACIAQCEQFTSDDGYFAGLVDTMSATEMSPELRVEMEEGIREAAAAYVDLATRLREQVLPTATETDAVGRERYSLFSRYFLGSTVDLEETYRGGRRSWPGSRRCAPRSPTRSCRDRRRPRRSPISTPTRDINSTASRRCRSGCRRGRRRDRGAGRHALRHPRPGAGPRGHASPRRRRAGSITPGRATTSLGPAGCGGRCPRA